VTPAAYRAVEFIKLNIKRGKHGEGLRGGFQEVVAICTQYAQKGMLNISCGVLRHASFAFLEPFFFVAT